MQEQKSTGNAKVKRRSTDIIFAIVWALAQSRGDGHRSLVTPERILSEYRDGHRSLVTPERILSEYNEDLI